MYFLAFNAKIMSPVPLTISQEPNSPFTTSVSNSKIFINKLIFLRFYCQI